MLSAVVLLVWGRVIPKSQAVFLRGEDQRRRALLSDGDSDSALEKEASILSNGVVGEYEEEEEQNENMEMIYDPQENEEKEEIMELLQDTPIMNMTYHGGQPVEIETIFPSGEKQQLTTEAPTDIVVFTDEDDEISINNDDDEYEPFLEKAVAETDKPTVVATTLAPSSAPTNVNVIISTGSPTVRVQPSTPSPTDGETEAPTLEDTAEGSTDSWWNDPNGSDEIEYEKSKMNNNSNNNNNQEDHHWTPTPSGTAPSWENAFGDHGKQEESPSSSSPSHEHNEESSSSSSQDTTTTSRSPTNPIDVLEQDAEEILRDKNVKIITPIFVVIALALMICVAQQMVENPDGCCARICRCSVGVSRYVVSSCLCCCCMSSQDKARRTHDLIVTDGFDDYDHDLQLQ